MEKIIAEIYFTGNNYCGYLPILPGCVSTGNTMEEMEKHLKEAVSFHIKGSLSDNDPIPQVFMGEYEIIFKYSTEALLNAYSNIFTKAALSRITGINERQLWHYAAGQRKPRPAQRARIEQGIHRLGKQLMSVTL